ATRRVPVMLAHGWGGVFAGGAAAAPAAAACGTGLNRLADDMVLCEEVASAPRQAAPAGRSRFGFLKRAIAGSGAKSAPVPPPPIVVLRDSLDRDDSPDDLHRLLATQSAAGAFQWLPTFEELARQADPEWLAHAAAAEKWIGDRVTGDVAERAAL